MKELMTNLLLNFRDGTLNALTAGPSSSSKIIKNNPKKLIPKILIKSFEKYLKAITALSTLLTVQGVGQIFGMWKGLRAEYSKFNGVFGLPTAHLVYHKNYP
jgi:hypothetical protein